MLQRAQTNLVQEPALVLVRGNEGGQVGRAEVRHHHVVEGSVTVALALALALRQRRRRRPRLGAEPPPRPRFSPPAAPPAWGGNRPDRCGANECVRTRGATSIDLHDQVQVQSPSAPVRAETLAHPSAALGLCGSRLRFRPQDPDLARSDPIAGGTAMDAGLLSWRERLGRGGRGAQAV